MPGLHLYLVQIVIQGGDWIDLRLFWLALLDSAAGVEMAVRQRWAWYSSR